MLCDRIALICVCLSLLAGCVAPETIQQDIAGDPPIQLTFQAPTLDRTEDNGAVFDLKQQLEQGPILMLWIGAGCSGCHDWTDLIRTNMDEGAFNGSNITMVSVHRWAQFETTHDVQTTFAGDTNSTSYSPWTVVVPQLDTPTYHFETGLDTGFPIYEAYNNPGTPTLHLIDQNGALAWQSKTYWANQTMLDEALAFFD